MRGFEARPAIPLYLSLILLFVATYLGGTHGISAVRFLYLIGCVAVAYQALRLGPAYHFEVLVVLFAFSPFLRRIVDYSCGYDAHGLMLSGPLLAALLPTIALPAAIFAKRGPLVGRLGPYLLATLCLGYAAMVSELNGHYVSAITGFGKSASVLLYGCWLLAYAENPQQLMRQGARAFAIVMPIVGLYGIMQFLNPSPADRYWMITSAMASIGFPEPQQVRVFSTLNSPASLGNFIVFGLVLVGVLGGRWALLICSGAAAAALLLSQSRTSWLALAGSIVFMLFFYRTKARSAMIAVVIASVGAFVIVATPLGDVILPRLQSVAGGLSGDGSALARLHDIRFIFDHLENYLVGSGMSWHAGTGEEYNPQETGAWDGLIVWSISVMGVFFGLAFVISILWVGLQAALRVGQRARPEFVVAGALVAGQLLTIPLNNPTGAEFGIFFWTVVAVALRTPTARRALPHHPSEPVFAHSRGEWLAGE
jgi:hypothetical protein